MKKFVVVLFFLLFKVASPAFAYEYVEDNGGFLSKETIVEIEKQSKITELNTSVKIKYVFSEDLSGKDYKKALKDQIEDMDTNKYVIVNLIKNPNTLDFYIEYSDLIKEKTEDYDRNSVVEDGREDIVNYGVNEGMLKVSKSLDRNLDFYSSEIKSAKKSSKSTHKLVTNIFKASGGIIVIIGFIFRKLKRLSKIKISFKGKKEKDNYAYDKYVKESSAEDFINKS